MARTNRNDVLEAGQQQSEVSASVDALDNINLDAMFAHDVDDSFLDDFGPLDLGDIGDIAAPTNKPPDSHQLDILATGGSDPLAVVAVPARRTTKRKIKSPAHSSLHRDDEEYQPTSKKRRRSTAAKKKGAATSTKATPATGASATGTRQKKTTKCVLSDVSSLDMRPSDHSSYCGLRPSSVVFYPFMPALPPEATLKKSSRLYSVLNPIYSAASSSQSQSQPTTVDQSFGLPDTDPLLQLVLAEEFTTSSVGGIVDPDQRRRATGNALQLARQTVSHSDKAKLIADLQSVCVLIKKQFDFLNQSLDNMTRWSMSKFTEKDCVAVFGPLSHRVGLNSRASLNGSGKGFAAFRSNFIKVKVRLPGFKAPKQSRLLVAKVPKRPGGPAPSSQSAASSFKTDKPIQKRRTASADVKLSSTVHAMQEEEVVTYVHMKPWQRRQAVTEAIAQQANQLDTHYLENFERRRRVLERQSIDLRKIVEDDALQVPNTGALWNWLDKAAYFAEFSDRDVSTVLQDLWELDNHDEVDTAHRLSTGKRRSPNETPSGRAGATSMINRLQSLLVDVGSDSDDDEHSNALGSESRTVDFESSVVLDFSALSPEERAYVHLRAVGLAMGSMSPQSVVPTVSVADTRRSGRSNGQSSKKTVAYEVDATVSREFANDIDDTVYRMRVALGKQVRITNERVSFLETAARSHVDERRKGKKREEEAVLISRYNQLLKKQKDAKRASNKTKTNKKDEGYVLPW